MRAHLEAVARVYPVLLIWAAFALLATEHLFHYPIGIMTLLGLWRLARAPGRMLGPPDAQLLLLAFALLWLPQLLALPDAADPGRAGKTAFAYLHFLPCALFILDAARAPAQRRLITAGVALVCAFWVLDALVQFAVGRDFFGYPHDGPMLKGAFYPKQRLGLVLAAFGPLVVLGLRTLARRHPAAWLLMLPYCVVILLSLKRTAWIMLAVGIAGGLWYLVRVLRVRPAMLAGGLALALGGMALTVALSPELQARLDATSGVMSADAEAFDRASSYRLSLWRTGLEIYRAHWVNGVGPRGYRTAYFDYAAADDFWRERGGQTHPHLMVLEVMTETGSLGLLGYLGFLALLLRAMRGGALSDGQAFGWLLAAFVAAFPLNAHLAFYGSYWGSLLWLLLPVGLARPPRASSV